MDSISTLELSPEDDAILREERTRAKLELLESRRRECDSFVQAAKPLHEQMIQNIRQYEGLPRTVKKTKTQRAGSETSGPPVLQATRSKTDLVIARAIDMLFPTAQPQWRLDPEPVNELGDMVDPETGQPMTKDQTDAIVSAEVKELETELRDQFIEAKFPAIARRVIEDAGIMGIGVVYAPSTAVKRRERYMKASDGMETVVNVEIETEARPGIEYIDPFMFFPQPVEDLSKASGAFDLKLMTDGELRELALHPDADPEAIRALLECKDKPDFGIVGSMIADRNARTSFREVMENRYPVWRYNGCLKAEEIKLLFGCECDTLAQLPMVQLWYCGDKLLLSRFGALKHGYRIPFHVFTMFRDRGTWSGLGVPFLCRDSARAAQACYEMGLHNLAMSTGMFLFYRGDIEPEDGDMEINGPKVVRVLNDDKDMGDLIKVEVIPNHSEHIFNALDRQLALMDEDINLPQFTNPEVNKPTNTASGMAMWMNAQTVVQRRIAANFDDFMEPLLSDFIRWNRTYNEKFVDAPDVQVVPLGQSELLVKDIQIQNAMMFSQMAGPGGALDGRVDMDVIAKHLAQKFEVPEGALLTPDQIAERQKQEQERQQNDPKLALEQAKIQQMQAETKLADLRLQAETQDKERDDALRRDDRMLDHEERLQEIALKRELAQLEVMKIDAAREMKYLELAQNKELNIAELQAQLKSEEMRTQRAEYQAAMKARIDAEKIASQSREMRLKLSPANPTNTGI
jgi:hypothetical protein